MPKPTRLQRLEYHPLANLFPMLDEAALRELADDIRQHGLLEPITLYQGKILDGRNRDEACLIAGVEPWFVEFNGNDTQALALVVSRNLHRRHLTDSQRAMIAANLATMRRGDNSNVPIGTLSQADAAEALNVSRRSVARAAVVRNEGTPELIAAVEAGDIPVSTAANLVREPSQRQRAPRDGAKTKSIVSRAGRPRTHAPHQPIATSFSPLTPAQIDPEFVGTPFEFTDRHGHLRFETAQQQATSFFSTLTQEVRALVKTAEGLPAGRREFDAYWLNWLRSPKPRDIARLTEALEYLRPRIAEAEAALARAVGVPDATPVRGRSIKQMTSYDEVKEDVLTRLKAIAEEVGLTPLEVAKVIISFTDAKADDPALLDKLRLLREFNPTGERLDN